MSVHVHVHVHYIRDCRDTNIDCALSEYVCVYTTIIDGENVGRQFRKEKKSLSMLCLPQKKFDISEEEAEFLKVCLKDNTVELIQPYMGNLANLVWALAEV